MKARILTHTLHPEGILIYTWYSARYRPTRGEELPSPADWEAHLRGETDLSRWCEALGIPHTDHEESVHHLQDLIRQLVSTGVAVAEMVVFTFLLEDIPISLREQLVRHKVGTRTGDTEFALYGIPDLIGSSFWVQSMRAVKVSSEEERPYHTPSTIEENTHARQLYEETMGAMYQTYTELLELGIPPEDARMVIPGGTTHHMVWSVNCRALRSIFQSRSCWIAQAGLWGKILADMMEEIHSISPTIAEALGYPPCISNGKYRSCPMSSFMEDRLTDKEHMLPCPLYLRNEVPPDRETVGAWRRGGKYHGWEPPSSYDLDYEHHLKHEKEVLRLWRASKLY